MKEPIKTDDFHNLRFKKKAMKFLRQLPNDDIALVEDKDLASAELLKENGLIDIKILTSGEHAGKTVCYKLMRSDMYLAYMDGIQQEKRQIWILWLLSPNFLIALVISSRAIAFLLVLTNSTFHVTMVKELTL